MPTVLVVDDSLVDRRVVGGLLAKDPDLSVEFAEDGAAALSYLETKTPDVIVTDLIMPDVDGLQLVASVVKTFPRLPVVLMTGQGSDTIAAEALRVGATSYVPKIAMSQMLLATVRRLLEISASTQSKDRLMIWMVKNEMSFTMASDLSLVPALVEYLHGCLRSFGLNDDSEGMRISVALEEALSNAIYHGNLELSSDLRDDAELYRKTLQERRTAKPFCDRKIQVDVQLTRQSATIRIRDEGPGFNPQTLPDPTDPASLEKIGGRGVLLMRTFMDQVTYNATGNEVTLMKNLIADEPALSR